MIPSPPRPDPADDPRLTAFLLGEEMDPATRAEMDALLRNSPAATAWESEVRQLAAGLRAEFDGDRPFAGATTTRHPAAMPVPDDRVLVFPGRGAPWKLAALAAGIAVAAGFLVVWPMFLPDAARHPLAEGSRLITIETDPKNAASSLVDQGTPAASASAGFTTATAQRASALVPNAGTESAKLIRASLERGERPPPEVVRIEEMVNHFLPGDPAATAGIRLDAAAAPWNPAHLLVRVVFSAGPATTSGWQVRVEFNPDRVASWRLLGHESRRAEPAQPTSESEGTIPAGRAVTTFYEIIPTAPTDSTSVAGKWLTVHTAWRGNGGGQDELALAGAIRPFAEASADFRFAAAVAAFGLALRDELSAANGAGLAQLSEWVGEVENGRQAEFLDLVEQMRRLQEGRDRAGG